MRVWRPITIIATFCLLGVGVAGEPGSDWPSWRGPDGTRVSDQQPLPENWSDDDNVAWRAPLRGLGVSSPIVSGDRAYVTWQLGQGDRRPGNHPALARGSDEADLERPLGEGREVDESGVVFALAAFDRDSGAEVWVHELPAAEPLPPVHDKHNLASPSPVTDGERVYAWFATGQLVAVDLEGETVWSRHLGEEFTPFEIAWGHSSSPTVYGDLLILQADHEPASYLLALEARTGEQVWRADRGSGLRSYSTPVVVPGAAGDELIVNSSHRLDGYDPTSGELLWSIEEPNQFPVPSATHADGVVYTSRGYRSGPFMSLAAGGRGTLTEADLGWRIATGAPYISSVLYYRGHVYMATGNGVVTITDAGSGERVWQQRVGGIYTASPAAGDGKVYLFSETGETVVLAAGAEPRVLARNRLSGRVIGSPAIAGGSLFIRTDDHLVRIGN